MYRIGIDVGGTFTDLVLGAAATASIRLGKSPTTPRRSVASACSNGIALLARGEGLDAGQAAGARPAPIVHGTTTADNTMIEMSGAVTGLITTAGPSRRDRAAARLQGRHLGPGACRRRRRSRRAAAASACRSGSTSKGNVVTPLDEAAVRAALRRLTQLGTESLAVVFMFSFINPAHERRVREIAAEECPEHQSSRCRTR